MTSETPCHHSPVCVVVDRRYTRIWFHGSGRTIADVYWRGKDNKDGKNCVFKRWGVANKWCNCASNSVNGDFGGRCGNART